MTAAQNAAFQAASGIAPNAMALYFASFVSLAVLLWYVWITRSLYTHWTSRGISFHEFIFRVVRGAIVLLLLTYFIRP